MKLSFDLSGKVKVIPSAHISFASSCLSNHLIAAHLKLMRRPEHEPKSKKIGKSMKNLYKRFFRL